MILAVVTVELLLLAAIIARQPQTKWSRFELERRADLGDITAARSLERLAVNYQFRALRLAIILLLSAVLGVLMTLFYSWFGFVATLVLLVISPTIGSLQRFTGPLKYPRLFVMRFIDILITRYPRFTKWLAGERPTSAKTQLGSRQELENLIENAGDALEPADRRLLLAASRFQTRLVQSVMIPLDKLTTVEPSDMLGPLLLSQLHETGQRSFLVMDPERRHLAGVVDITGLLTLNQKTSFRVGEVLVDDVVKLMPDDSLTTALKSLMRSSRALAVVQDDDSKTIGVVTLVDCIEALMGKNLVA